MGLQATGKSTLCKNLAQVLSTHLEGTDILRAEVKWPEKEDMTWSSFVNDTESWKAMRTSVSVFPVSDPDFPFTYDLQVRQHHSDVCI